MLHKSVASLQRGLANPLCIVLIPVHVLLKRGTAVGRDEVSVTQIDPGLKESASHSQIAGTTAVHHNWFISNLLL